MLRLFKQLFKKQPGKRSVSMPSSGQSHRPVKAGVTTPVSVSQPAAVDMVDTRSLFYDLLFGVSDADQPMNPLEKEILEKVELVLTRPQEIADNIVKLPAVLNQVSTLLASPDYSTDQLAALIAQEPVLAADFIKLVNSPALRRNGREIADLHQALVILGAKNIQETVLTAIMQKMADIKPIYLKLFGQQIWQHSLNTALWAKKLAKQRQLDPELAYFIGLIHDVGKIALFKLIVHEMNHADPAYQPNSKVFRQMMTKHSVLLSALIARHWRLPGAIVKPLYEQTDSYPQVSLTEQGRLLLEANLYSEISLLLSSGAVNDVQARDFCERNGLEWELCCVGVTPA